MKWCTTCKSSVKAGKFSHCRYAKCLPFTSRAGIFFYLILTFFAVKLRSFSKSAPYAPLVVLTCFSHPFCHFLRLFYFVPLRFTFFIRRKLCHSSHIFIGRLPFGILSCKIVNLLLSFLFCLHCISA